eukprot:scaffold11673_cov100-Isochrysis_galbana.AAC.7
MRAGRGASMEAGGRYLGGGGDRGEQGDGNDGHAPRQVRPWTRMPTPAPRVPCGTSRASVRG